MKELVFLLEEPSAQQMLEGILARMIDPSEIGVRYIVFSGKSDLEARMVYRMRKYQNPEARFIVIRDQDSAPDCAALKRHLVDKCIQAGQPEAIVRIFCKELETIYIADLQAVETALEIPGLGRQQQKQNYRSPDDRCVSPAQKLSDITGGVYQKVAGSRAIGRHLNLNNERSPSFKNLIGAIKRSIDSLYE